MLLSLAKKHTGKYSSNCNSAIANSRPVFLQRSAEPSLQYTLLCMHTLFKYLTRHAKCVLPFHSSALCSSKVPLAVRLQNNLSPQRWAPLHSQLLGGVGARASDGQPKQGRAISCNVVYKVAYLILKT